MEKHKTALVLLAIIITSAYTVHVPLRVHATHSLDDWPMSNHDPAHTGFSKSSVPKNPVLIWTFPSPNISFVERLHNPIMSSPAVVDGHLYIDGNCLNASTGRQVWTSGEIGGSPAVYNGYVYGSAPGLLAAVDAYTGALKWKTNYKNSYGNPESGGNPTVSYGIVYSQGYSAFYALNSTTGAEIWKDSNLEISSYAIANNYIYITSSSKHCLYALNAFTGEEIWKSLEIASFDARCSLSISDGRIYLNSGHNVHCFSASTGNLIWTSFATSLPMVGSPTVAYDMVYVGSWDKNIYALDASTGDMIWKFTTGSSGVHSSLAVADDIVYASSDDRYLYALNAATGELLWKYMTISANDLYATYNSMLAPPIVAEGHIYIGTNQGNLLAFGDSSEVVPSPSLPPTPLATPSPTIFTDSGWMLQTVDRNSVGDGVSLALDSNDNAHMCHVDHQNNYYRNPELVTYLTKNGSDWKMETVSPPAEAIRMTSGSLALDSNNNPHIVFRYERGLYYEAGLLYATWTGANWSIQTVDSTGNSGVIAVDSVSNPHIVYVGANSHSVLKYAVWTGQDWNIQTINPAEIVDQPGQSLALDSSSRPHVLYGSGSAVKYAVFNGSNWKTQTAALNSASFSNVALDTNGYPHFACVPSNSETLVLVSWNGSAWNKQPVVSGSNLVARSLALDAHGKPHVVYSNSDVLMYATWTSTAWNVQTVDAVNIIEGYGSIRADSEGNPHISYFGEPYMQSYESTVMYATVAETANSPSSSLSPNPTLTVPASTTLPPSLPPLSVLDSIIAITGIIMVAVVLVSTYSVYRARRKARA